MNLLAALLTLTSASYASEPSVRIGWGDEMNKPHNWVALEGRPVASTTPQYGSLRLSLEPVPEGWPYEYQWSGITQEAHVNIGKYPILLARVAEVEGYAHVDVDVIGLKGTVVKTLRSSTAIEPGVVRLNMSELGRGAFQLRLRAIVGGPNGGCRVSYNWVRFVRAADERFFVENPDFQNVSPEFIGRS